jgi:hypothetical protein
MATTLRTRVIEILEQAGYRNSEASLPTYASGGTFSALGGGTGVNVEVRWWTPPPMSSQGCARASRPRCGPPGWTCTS